MYSELEGDESFPGDVHHETYELGLFIEGPEEAKGSDFKAAFDQCKWNVDIELSFYINAELKEIGEVTSIKPGTWKIDTTWDIDLEVPEGVCNLMYSWLDTKGFIRINGELPEGWQIVGWN